MIVFLGNCILGGKPQIFFLIECVIEAASGKAFNRLVHIMDSLDNSRCLELMDSFFDNFSVCAGKYKLGLSGTRNLNLDILIYVAICMSCYCNRLMPVLYKRLDTFYDNRCTEYGSVKNGSYSSVRALPHLFKIVFCHTRSVRCNCSTLYGNSIFHVSIGCINRNLIISLVTMLKSKVVIFCIKIYEWAEEFFLDRLPENSCHLVPVHFHKRCSHLNFIHGIISL